MSFERQVQLRIEDNGKNANLMDAKSEFMRQSIKAEY